MVSVLTKMSFFLKNNRGLMFNYAFDKTFSKAHFTNLGMLIETKGLDSPPTWGAVTHRPPELDTAKPFSSTQNNVYAEIFLLKPRCASGFSNGLMAASVSSDGEYQKKDVFFCELGYQLNRDRTIQLEPTRMVTPSLSTNKCWPLSWF